MYTKRLVFGALVMLSAGAACERVAYYSEAGGAPATASGGATRGKTLAAIATCASSLYTEVAASAAALEQACVTARDTPSDSADAAAEAAWRQTIGLWQQAELIGVGPAAPETSPGGKGLRDKVYSWPLVSRCLSEQTLVSKSYEKPELFDTALVSTRGLWAGEYLLFYKGTDNACSEQSSINATGAWAALGEAEIRSRKRAYAAAIAGDVKRVTAEIADGWASGGGDFAKVLADAGETGSLFSTDQLAFNTISDGLLYMEIRVKDDKLAHPLGFVDCATAACPEALESTFAGVSRDHIRNNLIGFQRLFEGCEASSGQGLDDLLEGMGLGALAGDMRADIAGVFAALDAIDDPSLAKALAETPAKLFALHAALKQLTDRLKTDLVTSLDLELPQVIEGDND